MPCLWGPKKDLDFWKARARDLIPPTEARAMELLASVSDERRIAFYCLSGMFPALGNVSKRVYLVRRFHTVLELDAGRPCASLCILAKDRGFTPETDHVVAMKNLIEGEEVAFRAVANRFAWNYDPFFGQVGDLPGFPNEWVAPFCHCQADGEDDAFFLECQTGLIQRAILFQKHLRQQAEALAFRPRAIVQKAIERHHGSPPSNYDRLRPEDRQFLVSVRNGLEMYARPLLCAVGENPPGHAHLDDLAC